MSVQTNKDKIEEKTYKCICGREFESIPKYAGHVSQCKLYRKMKGKPEKRPGFHTIKKDYTCVCGKVLHTNASYCGHTSNCKIYLGEKRYEKNLEIKRRVCANKIYPSGEDWYKYHSEESLKQQSDTRKKKYASGELSPAKGVGRGKYSYVIYDNEKIMLRSTYEFIFAIWLYIHGYPINVEQIRVPAIIENRYSKTFISDFNIGNVVIEIKGIASGKDYYEKKSFIAAGYDYKILYYDKICELQKELENKGIDMKCELDKVINGHNNKDYYILDLTQFARVVELADTNDLSSL